VVDTSDNGLKIANVIFNGKVKVINVAVTVSNPNITPDEIILELYSVLNKVLEHEKLVHLKVPISKIKDVAKSPVQIKNEKRSVFSVNKTLCIGDAAGNSSPLAGMGGTLGLTLAPLIIEKFLNDFERHSPKLNITANVFSEAAVARWFFKSDNIKKMIMFLAFPDVSNVSKEVQEEQLPDESNAMVCRL